MPQLNALHSHWEACPPPAVALQMIGMVLGIPAPKKSVQTSVRAKKPQSAEDILREFAAAGIPVTEGRPDDPMLDLLD